MSSPVATSKEPGRIVGLILVALIIAAVISQLVASAGPGGSTQAHDEAESLAVTGSAPAVSAWRNGYQEAWTVDPAVLAEREPGLLGDKIEPRGSSQRYAGRTDSSVAFGVDVTAAGGIAVAVEADSGATDWATWTQEGCLGVVDGSLHCQGGRMGLYPTALLDMDTGEQTAWFESSEELGTGVPDGQQDSYGWHTGVVDGTLIAAWAHEPSAYGVSTGSVARLEADTESLAWTTDFEGRFYFGSIGSFGRTHHDIVTTPSAAIGADGGELFLEHGDNEPVEWVAQDVLQGGAGPSGDFTAPDGSALHWLGSPALSVSTSALPQLPVRVAGGSAVAFDPSDGDAEVWRVDVDPDRAERHIAVSGDQMMLVEQEVSGRTGARVTMIDTNDGTVAWTRLLPSVGAQDAQVWRATFTADGTPLIQASNLPPSDTNSTWYVDAAEVYALDPTGGATLWNRAGSLADAAIHSVAMVPFAPDTEAYDSIVMDDFDGTFTLLEPGTTSETPEAMPSCPDGMDVVSWTHYSTGSVLLCSGESGYRLVLDDPDRESWEPRELEFTTWGYRLTFTNGAEIAVQAGGSLISFESDGTSAVEAAEAWTASYGEIDMSSASDVPSCPSGSVALSLSEYADGWLLVCGTTADDPTAVEFSRAGKAQSGSDARAVTGGYCANLATGEVCIFPDQGVITEDRDGALTSYPVDCGYTEGSGSTQAESESGETDDSLAQLKALAKSDGATIELDSRWVAQLASKYVGVNDPLQETVEGSHTFAAKDILAEHMRLRSTADAARVLLLDSRTYGKRTGYNGQPIFVTVALDSSFTSADAVQAWCRAQYPNKSGAALENVCLASRLTP